MLDVQKFSKALEAGEIHGGESVNKLLAHLLKPDPNHPLEAIRIRDMSPYEWQQFFGPNQIQGKFTLYPGQREGTVQVLTKHNNGKPISQSDFLQTLTHELTHNAVTSKYQFASDDPFGMHLIAR
mgnify:CR=1 FL=1